MCGWFSEHYQHHFLMHDFCLILLFVHVLLLLLKTHFYALHDRTSIIRNPQKNKKKLLYLHVSSRKDKELLGANAYTT